ncbi:MAG: hypothetical protein HXY40_18910 [Chloroflexi bacterium]|nr:hypothetical protein [Chloroflexota bacterium]
MTNRAPARAVAQLMMFAMLAASGAAFCTASSGNTQGAMAICGAGIGAALLILLLGAVFVAVAKRGQP